MTSSFDAPNAFGKNPLAGFVASSAIIKLLALIKIGEQGIYGWLSNNVFQTLFGNNFGSLVQAISYAMMIWLFAWLLYRKNMIIRL